MYLDRQGAGVLHPLPSPNRSLDKASLHMARPFTNLALPRTTSSCVLPHWNRARTFYSCTHLMSHKKFSPSYNVPLKRKYLVCTLVSISRLVKNFSMKVNWILSFTFFTFNIVCGENLKGVGPLVDWLNSPRLERMGRCKLRRHFQRRLNRK